MRSENCNHEITTRKKINFLFAALFLSALCFWFLYSWGVSIYETYMLANSIKFSVGGTFAGFSSIGVIVWTWLAFITAMKTNKKASNSWNDKQKKMHNKMLISCCVVAVIISSISYFYIDNRLMNNGYTVKTKYTNVNIYKTYTKN
ncbi:hypothetical protein UB33_21670 [Photobacterium angustum]|uniref:hypothetical protein n=1 Tax=Photobacterium angustum TaxID=661 RepID=UPI0005E0370C|nr:hypothetical protein [Photobacterium angustum]KJG03913.1 hypothetical protein UB33_21670 [Photobacterium angustum]PSV94068.1 hypothetical protein CTN01_08710 [Photobacterium angustum]